MPRRSGRRAQRAVPAAVEAVRSRIEQWRATREKRNRMPEDMWDAAAAVAREHGLWFVSRALRVNYESLKQRVESLPDDGGAAGFVEVSTSGLVSGTAPATTTLELSSKAGARLTVRLEGHAALDVPALATAFWQRHR